MSILNLHSCYDEVESQAGDKGGQGVGSHCLVVAGGLECLLHSMTYALSVGKPMAVCWGLRLGEAFTHNSL